MARNSFTSFEELLNNANYSFEKRVEKAQHQDQNIANNLKIGTDKGKAKWINIEEWTILESDKHGFIQIGEELQKNWYIVLVQKSGN